MALREKLTERAQPFLEPGEQVQQVFLGQTGPSPMFVLVSYLIMLWSKFYVVVVTDRGILLLRSGALVPSKPKELAARLPRDVRIGPMSGLWGKTESLGPNKMWVHKRFHKDVAAADAQITGGEATYPG
jgi:hypothetical protein